MRLLVTGAAGMLGQDVRGVARRAGHDVVAVARGELDITDLDAVRRAVDAARPDAVVNCAAWTDVDGAEADEEGALAVNEGGTRRVVSLGAPVVYFSTDYVFDGEKREPYVESDEPCPLSAYGRTKLAGERVVERGWIVRSSWLFGPTGRNFIRTMLALAEERGEVAVVDDQRGCPTYVGHLAAASRRLLELSQGVWHVAAEGDCTWAEFAEAIFAESGLACRVRRISTAELGRPAPRPAYSVLRSERPQAPRLPDWRDGLRTCLERLGRARH